MKMKIPTKKKKRADGHYYEKIILEHIMNGWLHPRQINHHYIIQI
jgi:hypothetical protein